MKLVLPSVRLVARPAIDWDALCVYGEEVGAGDWLASRDGHHHPDAEILIEAAGRMCYRSWAPGLNPNVTRVREDRAAYLRNILRSGHGSVLEHANFTFVFRHVSRVLTHELVRHRAGTAVSQESMRYVRLDEIPLWMPEWARDDPSLMALIQEHLDSSENLLKIMAGYFDLAEEESFHKKKAITSFMRRLVPGGVATDLMWTANLRALRHIVELRTAPGAEEEIRMVFSRVAEIMTREAPLLFGDFGQNEDGAWVPEWSKV